MRTTIVLIVLLTCRAAAAVEQNFAYPGGVAQLILTKESSEIPEVKFGLVEPLIMEYQNHWRVLIGLGLDTLPGEYVVYQKSGVKGASGRHEKLVVKQHIYPFKEYAVINQKSSESAVHQIHKSYNSLDFSNTQQPALPLRWPVEGRWSNNFGHKLYDSENKLLHIPNAVVLKSTQITTVVAPQTAIVSKIEPLDEHRSRVFLDHGRGLYSVLSGLSDLTIELGNGIVAGAVIGKLSGSKNTSSTKPESVSLVWQTIINDHYVDPQILTQLDP